MSNYLIFFNALCLYFDLGSKIFRVVLIPVVFLCLLHRGNWVGFRCGIF